MHILSDVIAILIHFSPSGSMFTFFKLYNEIKLYYLY